MSRLLLLCLLLLAAIPIHAQSTPELAPPSQIMQLGRGTVGTFDWHPNAKVLAVGGSLGIWLYDDRLADVAHFPDAGSVAWLAWSPRGDQLATADWEDTVSVWDVNLESYLFTLHRSWTVQDEGYSLRFAWSPNSERLAVTMSDETQVFDVNTGETVLTIPDLEYALAWHPDGTRIAGAIDLGDGAGMQVRVWDASTGDIVATYASENSDLFWTNIQWSPDGAVLVGLTSIPTTLHVWSTDSGDLLNDVDMVLDGFSTYFGLWWLDGGRQFVTASRYVSPPSGTFLDIWDTENWTTQGQGYSIPDVRGIAKHPDTDIWTLLTWDSTIMIWGLEQEAPLQVASLHSQPAQIIEWSSDNRHLAAANWNSTAISIWDMTIHEQPQLQTAPVPLQDWSLDELRWSADDSTLIGFQSAPNITAPGAFSTAFVVQWDAHTGEYLGFLHETPGYVDWNGSSNYLPRYVWSDDFTRVVTMMRGLPLTISTAGGENGFLSPAEEISTIAIADGSSEIIWSPDNTMLAFIKTDSQGETSAWVYDAETGNLINRLRPYFFTTLDDISWSPDSTMLAVVGTRDIAGSAAIESRLDVLAVDPSSNESRTITSILTTDATFYHAWDPESRNIAISTASDIGIYRVENIPMGDDALRIATIPAMGISALAWSPDGAWLAGSHEDGTIRVWDVTRDSSK